MFAKEKYIKLAEHNRVVAIGECGLDYFSEPTEEQKEKQREVFIAQIELANEMELPLMLHLRNGKEGNVYKEAYDILKKHSKVLGNSHFFAGSLEDAKRFWELGHTISFTGVITFTDAYNEVVKETPLEMIHAETDAPYVAPVPYRGKRNEPLYVREVVKKMAQIKDISEESLKEQLIENAKKSFSI